MPNIWAFLLQTLTVSLVAALLLLIKRLLVDKLSPRWQYGIWGLLALRVLIPAEISRNVVVGFGIWLEIAKSRVEAGLASVYSAVYEPISMNHIFPWVGKSPESVTDWLFVVYGAGIVFFALRYLVSYVLLRLRLRGGEAPSGAVTEAMDRVCGKYGLKPCRVVAVPGLGSAFVCGVVRPVLAVPAGAAVDDKVILHELLHLKHLDILQGIFWAALRCLHWCNPFMHYVFDRIGNDMESLCDQRVLERLEGEERREYGEILLSMASRRYARTPGTGSISNGAKNISRRIDAIVRFKKYPRGMNLVSICIALTMLSPLLIGTAAAYDNGEYMPCTAEDMTRAMAIARVQRCTTVAGAIDTYAKGLLYENGIYIAIASPLDKHETLRAEMGDFWSLDNGEYLNYVDTSKNYAIYDLVENSNGTYHAFIAFGMDRIAAGEYADLPITGEISVVIPLRIFRENDSWVVEERDERTLYDTWLSQLGYYTEGMPFRLHETVQSDTGTVEVIYRSMHSIDNTVTTNNIFGWTSYDTAIKPDAQFSYVSWDSQIVYQCDMDRDDLPQQTAGIQIWELESMDDLDKIDTSEMLPDLRSDYQAQSGNSTSGYSYQIIRITEEWSGVLSCNSGGGYGDGVGIDVKDLPEPPAGYFVRIFFDGEAVEEMVIEGVPQ